jgi:hypothetical protein
MVSQVYYYPYEPPSELARELLKISANNAVDDTVKAVVLGLAEKQARALSLSWP